MHIILFATVIPITNIVSIIIMYVMNKTSAVLTRDAQHGLYGQ